MSNTNVLEIEFKKNLKNFVPEIVARIIYITICSVILSNHDLKQSFGDHKIFYACLFFMFNIIIFCLTFYGTSRRKKTILSFIYMRLKSHKIYADSKINIKSNFSTGNFYVYTVLSSVLFGISVIVVFLFIQPFSPDKDWLFVPLAFLPTAFYAYMVWKFRMNYISHEIRSVYYERKRLPKKELNEFVKYLFHQSKEDKVYYNNDEMLFELEKKSNIFKHRVESLLIESVFIGALAFGTFIQLTSPESITSYDTINSKGSNYSEESDFGTTEKNRYKSILIELFYPGDSLAEIRSKLTDLTQNSKLLEESIEKIKSTDSILGKSDVNNSRFDFFKEWTEEKIYAVFSFFYKNFRSDISTDLIYLNATENKVDFNQINSTHFAKLVEDSTRTMSLNDTLFRPFRHKFKPAKDSIFKEIKVFKSYYQAVTNKEKKGIVVVNQDSIQKEKKVAIEMINLFCQNYRNAKLLNYMFKVIDQKAIYQLIYKKNPLEVNELERARILEILHFHNKTKFLKFQNITKKSWDEQEYLFFIAIGSIFCSILYISVLISRFAIIIRIEKLASEIKKAEVWNKREEQILERITLIEYESNHQADSKELVNKREYYTEKLQMKLAFCEYLSYKIETNLQILTFIRNWGLYTFFIVLLIGTMMIDPRITFILANILIYAILVSSFMQEGSNTNHLWNRLTGLKKSLQQDSYNDL